MLMLSACQRDRNETHVNYNQPKVVEAKGYVVPKDSMAEPKVIILDESKLKKIPVGKPKVVPTNTNVHPAGKGKVVMVDETKLRVIIPGTDTFSMPKIVPAFDSFVVAGVPEVLLPKGRVVKDHNPHGFSSFSRLQGLKHDAITCLLQDRLDNIWFGSNGGGISKYDGKRFTHYTEVEGLGKNEVRAMLEDKAGNLWFGMAGGSILKFDGKHFIHFNSSYNYLNNYVLSILEDKNGNLWFGTDGGGVLKLSPAHVAQKKQQKHLINNYTFTHFTQQEGLINNYVNCIIEDKFGSLWFGTEAGVCRLTLGKSPIYSGDKNSADTEYTFTHFSEKDGLSSNLVFSIVEDKTGMLWFGTESGVTQYNGNIVDDQINDTRIYSPSLKDPEVNKRDLVKKFTHFTENEGLVSNYILSMMEDRAGNLWFGTYEGISKYDGNCIDRIMDKGSLQSTSQGDLKKYMHDTIRTFMNFTESEGLSNNTVFCMLEDKTGNLWFGTGGGGLSEYDGKMFSHFTEKEGLSNSIIVSILEDKAGRLWFGTWGGGVCMYDGNSSCGKEGRIKIKPSEQNFRNLKNLDLKKSFFNFSESEGLINNFVTAILEDKYGSLWFGTKDGGVCKFSIDDSAKMQGRKILGYQNYTFTHFTEKEGLGGNAILDIHEDKNGCIWFATNGGGVFKLTQNLSIPNHSAESPNRYNYSLMHFTENEGLSNNKVYSILEDNRGNLWFGTYGGITKYDGNLVDDVVNQSRIYTMSKNEHDRIRRNPVKSFMHFTVNEGLSDNVVKTLIQDKSGNLWFGTEGGISRLSMKRRSAKSGDTEESDEKFIFTHFTEREGLTNNYISSVIQDSKGNLWFGTRSGLSRLSTDKLLEIENYVLYRRKNNLNVLFKNFNYEDGFLGIGIYGGKTLCEDKNGTIWIGANNRLTAFQPEADCSDTSAPNIQLTGIALFNEEIDFRNFERSQDTTLTLGNGVRVKDVSFNSIAPWYPVPENLVLSHNNNYFTFNYIGITQNQSNKVKYQYKLDGLDANWSSLTERTEASYANLSHGTYTFKVKAMNSEGYWSKPYAYTFTIRPPWWKSIWAYGLYIFSGFIGVTGFLRWRDRTAILRRKVLQQKVTEATAEILNQKELVERQKNEVLDQKEMLEKQKEELVKQKQRSDELLLNILPHEIAEELKANGMSKARHFDEATVLFTDFKGFTSISESMSAEELVSELHFCFSAFDKIMIKYGLEKIKTIGDSYMAVAGVPDVSEENAVDAIRAGLAIIRFMSKHNELKREQGKEIFEIRIGIHSGPLIAGIVGVKKFQFDIWGDTVNTASRMESNGEVGKVNISSTTYELVKPYFHFEHRGEIEVKGKGKLDMYFVKDKKSSLGL